MSRPEIEPGPPAWEASTLEKSHPDSLLIAIQNIEYIFLLFDQFFALEILFKIK